MMIYKKNAQGAFILALGIAISGCSSTQITDIYKSEGRLAYEKAFSINHNYRSQGKHEEYLKQSSDLGYEKGQLEYGKFLVARKFDEEQVKDGLGLLRSLETSGNKEAASYLRSERNIIETKLSALGGDEAALINLCATYIEDERSTTNPIEEVCQKAADTGDIGAIYNNGLYLVSNEQKETGLKYVTKAAEKGLSKAQWYLYRNTDVDAQKWFDRALANHYPKALYEKGMVLVKQGDENYEVGVRYLREAANEGHYEADRYIKENEFYISVFRGLKNKEPEALFKYGKHVINESGKYTDEDGLSYIKEAAKKNYAPANEFLAVHADVIEADTIIKNGNAQEMLNTGLRIYSIEGPRGDLTQVFKLLEASSHLGSGSASRKLAVIYEQTGKTRQAIKYYIKAGEQESDAISYNDAAVLLYNTNAGDWLKYLQLSARMGNHTAVTNLNMFSNYYSVACANLHCSSTIPRPTFYR